MIYSTIDILTVLLIILAIAALVYFLIILYRANHVFSKWQGVSDTLADATVKLVPAIINATNIAMAIHKVLEIIAEKKKESKESKKK